MKCHWCEDEAVNECDYCYKLFCKKHGDTYGIEPNQEFICNECLINIDLEEQAQMLDELFLEEFEEELSEKEK